MILTNHVHEFDSGKYAAGTSEGFEIQRRPNSPLDGSMVLLDDVVEIFCLAYCDRSYAVTINGIKDCFVGTAFVQIDLIRDPIGANGLVEETSSSPHISLHRE